MKRLVRWIGFNGVFAIALYFAFFEEVAFLQIGIGVATWLMLAISFFFMTKPVVTALALQPDKITPRWMTPFDVAFDAAIIAVFVAFNWWWTGVAYLVQMVITQAVMTEARARTSVKE